MKRYESVGEALKGEELIRILLKELIEARADCNPDHPFYLVDAPSGTGKSQLPFTLKAAGVKVCHLLLNTDQQTQSIYQPLLPLSRLFEGCLLNDRNTLQAFEMQSDVLRSDSLRRTHLPLETVGFLLLVLGCHLPDPSDWTPLYLSGKVRNLPDEQRVIIFLDEVFPYPDGSEIPTKSVVSLRLARNLLRAVGLVVVLMGTNSSASNFADFSYAARSSNPYEWCRIITRLPRITDASLVALDVLSKLNDIRCFSLQTFLRDAFRTCIPWFASLFVKVMRRFQEEKSVFSTSCELFDAILEHMSRLIYERKRLLRVGSGLSGQYCLHLCCHKFGLISQPDGECLSNKQTSSFVSSHFAYLNEEDEISLFLRNVGLYSNSQPQRNESVWRPTASFYGATKDPLLYLLLGGGREGFPEPFVSSQDNQTTVMTTYQVRQHLYDQERVKTRRNRINDDNTRSQHRDGLILEAMAAVAMEIASHRGGVCGIRVDEFLLRLVHELQLSMESRSTMIEWEDKFKPSAYLTNDFTDLVVPYLSPSNDPWPPSLTRVDETKFGNLIRPGDQEKCDFQVQYDDTIVISGEAKNHDEDEPINLEIVRNIVQRFPKTSTLHLVFAPNLQPTDFKNVSGWDTFKAELNQQIPNTHSGIQSKKKGTVKKKDIIDLDKVALLRVVVKNSKLSLKPLFTNGPMSSAPNKEQFSPDRAIIFFPLDSLQVAVVTVVLFS